MSNEITKQQKCVVIRAGQEIWLDQNLIEPLEVLLQDTSRFIWIDGELVNKADVVGVFSPQRMEDASRRKNGQWKCDSGRWHDRFEKCTHKDKEYEDKQDMLKEKMRSCAKCLGDGYQIIHGIKTTILCECIVDSV